MSDKAFQIDPHGVERFCALREEAIAHALAASERAFPEVYARFGPKDPAACAEDLGFHHDFLQPATILAALPLALGGALFALFS